jgi:hypothetical protein
LYHFLVFYITVIHMNMVSVSSLKGM